MNWSLGQIFLSNKSSENDNCLFKIHEIEINNETGKLMYLCTPLNYSAKELEIFCEDEMMEPIKYKAE